MLISTEEWDKIKRRMTCFNNLKMIFTKGSLVVIIKLFIDTVLR